MVPFIVLIALFILFGAIGRFHIVIPYGWWTSLSLALSGMFLLTASAHWGSVARISFRWFHPFFLGPISWSRRPESWRFSEQSDS
jgi:hypothetical protein